MAIKKRPSANRKAYPAKARAKGRAKPGKPARPAAKKPAAKKAARPAKKPAAKPAPKAAPKPAKAKAPRRPPASPAATAPADTVYTLSQLLARIGKGAAQPTEAEVRQLVSLPEPLLVDLGREVSTDRIDVDTARLYGIALDFWLRATPEQQAALLGFSTRYLHCAIWAAEKGQTMNQIRGRDLAVAANRQQQRAADGRTLREVAVARREQLKSALLRLSGGGLVAKTEIQGAYGQMKETEQLANSLEALAQLGLRYLRDKDPGVVARRALIVLPEAVLKETQELAAKIRTVGTAAEAVREQTGISQSELDLWDGINLTLLQNIVDAFDAGHAASPTVPRLLPLSLMRWFGRARPTKKGQPKAPGADAPETP